MSKLKAASVKKIGITEQQIPRDPIFINELEQGIIQNTIKNVLSKNSLTDKESTDICEYICPFKMSFQNNRELKI